MYSKIQSVFELSDGSGLAVTVARYETPAHTDIDKVYHGTYSMSSYKRKSYCLINIIHLLFIVDWHNPGLSSSSIIS